MNSTLMSASEYLSTSALARELDVPSNELFSKLSGMGWIDRKGDKWVLTDLGRSKGGQTRTNPKFGEFIVWPEDVDLTNGTSAKGKHLNATAIGKHFKISSQRVNLTMAELGWVEKNVAGWMLTRLGKSLGGRQLEHDSGATYVIWPPEILENRRLLDVVAPIEVKDDQFTPVPVLEQTNEQVHLNGRDKYPAKHRATDGHMVRSRAEMLIDNWLYTSGIVHAYGRKLPVAEDLICDFYIPAGQGRPHGVYIEFWGMEEDPKYAERKKKKLEIYRRNEIRLIELNSGDVDNLDDVLPRKLLQFEIKVG